MWCTIHFRLVLHSLHAYTSTTLSTGDRCCCFEHFAISVRENSTQPKNTFVFSLEIENTNFPWRTFRSFQTIYAWWLWISFLLLCDKFDQAWPQYCTYTGNCLISGWGKRKLILTARNSIASNWTIKINAIFLNNLPLYMVTALQSLILMDAYYMRVGITINASATSMGNK